MHRLIDLFVIAAVMLMAAPLQAQQYPSKPIRIIVPFPPGDTLDTMSRLISPKLTERLGQPIVVDNRVGGAGQIGLELASHAPADGYTIVGGQGGNLVVQPHTYKKLPYDTFKNFVPVANSTRNYLGLVVNAGGQFKSLKDFVAYGRANAGKLSFASNGEGGFPHMAIEMMRLQAGFTYLHVPYKGSAQIVTEILGNHIDATILGIGSIAPFIQGGRLRLLAVTSPTRAALFPDVPAMAEMLPGYDSRGWFGYLAPAGTPPKIVALLNAEINRAMMAPEVREKLENTGLTVVAESPEAFAQTLKSDYEIYGKLIKTIGLQPQ
jgi:tripartite-type tricarboxylate transporter receptor subunit TctC